MKSKLLHYAPRCVIMLLGVALGVLSADAKLLPVNEEYFPDAVVRQWLDERCPSALSTVDGVKYVETDKVTDVTSLITYQPNQNNAYFRSVVDLRCLRYFTKLEGILTFNYNFADKLKYIDVSGLKGVTEISNAIDNNGTTNTAGKMDSLIEVLADGCENLKTFKFNNCQNLERVSVKDCPALTAFYCGKNSYYSAKDNTKLHVIDLRDSPNLNKIWVQNNRALKELRLAPAGRQFTPNHYTGVEESTEDIYIQCRNCIIEDLDMRNFYTTSNSNMYVTLNCQDNRIRRIRFNMDAKILGFKALFLTNNALTDIDMPHQNDHSQEYTITTASSSSTQKANIGMESTVVLSENYMRGTFNKPSNGTINRSPGKATTYTFKNDRITSDSYEYTPLGDMGTCEKLKFRCTLTRKKPMQMWVCGEFNGWTISKDGNWTAPSDWDNIKDDWELKHTGYGTYVLKYVGEVEGDYRFLVNDPNYTKASEKTYWLGASHADLVTHHTAVVMNEHPGQGAAKAVGDKIYDLSEEPVSNFDKFNYVSHVENDGTPLMVVKGSTYPFSTHPCRQNDGKGDVRHSHVDPVFAVNFISGNTTSGLGLGAPDLPVGIETPSVAVDENAPEEWYDMQGVRVNPEHAAPGIYVVRKGGESFKVLVQ